MNSIYLLVFAEDDDLTEKALSLHVPIRKLHYQDVIPDDNGLVLVEGKNLSGALKNHHESLYRNIISKGKWLVVIPPFDVEPYEIEIAGTTTRFRATESRRSKHMTCNCESESDPFEILSNLKLEVHGLSELCHNEHGDSVVARTNLNQLGQVVLCVAEVGRLSAVTSAESVQRFFVFLENVRRESWSNRGIKMLARARITHDSQALEDIRSSSIIALAGVSKNGHFSENDWFKVFHEMCPSIDHSIFVEALNEWARLDLLRIENGSIIINPDKLKKEAHERGLAAFLRRL